MQIHPSKHLINYFKDAWRSPLMEISMHEASLIQDTTQRDGIDFCCYLTRAESIICNIYFFILMTNEIWPAPICQCFLWADAVGLSGGAAATLLWAANPIHAPVTQSSAPWGWLSSAGVLLPGTRLAAEHQGINVVLPKITAMTHFVLEQSEAMALLRWYIIAHQLRW